jgi:hypothetical protein
MLRGEVSIDAQTPALVRSAAAAIELPREGLSR